MKHLLGSTPWKLKSLLGVFVLVASIATISCTEEFSSVPMSTDNSTMAKPPGIEFGDKLVYKFNLIGYPKGKEYTGGCGNGHRIFVNREANHAHILLTDTDDGWWIEDCNATQDKRAVLHTDQADVYFIYVRLLGKPGGHLNVCADTLYDDGTTHDHECYLGEIDLTRGSGKSQFAIQPASIFDASLEDIIWSVETNADYRIAEFRVYQ
jgi:hypothetical protein